MRDRKMIASELATQSGLSLTTVSRILRDTNDRAQSYMPSEEAVVALSLALKLSYSEYKELLDAAFPERLFWQEALLNHWSVFDLNETLYYNGLPTLTKFEKDDE
jgi:transcriptional regulator with XRE-family HTH domain